MRAVLDVRYSQAGLQQTPRFPLAPCQCPAEEYPNLGQDKETLRFLPGPGKPGWGPILLADEQ